MAGLYIHIPFCASRCIYCGFFSSTSLLSRDAYVDALCHEMEIRKDYLHESVETVYLGGGTPSQLSFNSLQQISYYIRKIYFSDGSQPTEFTIECNPDDVTTEFCDNLKSLPVNRVSMGAQTFSDKRLQFLHRRHSAEEVTIAVQRLRSAGIKNISIDLMFGFPGETLNEWEEDLRMALALNPQHISAYSLMYEKGTPLYNMLQKGEIDEIEEELSRKMYDKLVDMLTSAGYEHYEISNFARPGYRSKHNSSYWNETPYLGIGAAAHSYNGTSRQWNISNIKDYIDNISNNILPSEKEELDLPTRYDDIITTALRTCDGINLIKMRKEYGEKLYHYLLESSKKEINNGLMKIECDHLSLTRNGLYISDDIMSDLMYVNDSSDL